MSEPTSILTISREKQLQGLRSMILRRDGYHVEEACTDAEAIRMVEAPNNFKLVLLCHSVPEESRVTIVDRIKTINQKLPVLMLYNGWDPTNAKVDGSLHNLEDPGMWLSMIRFLVRDTTAPA